jgi:hypothetical protein
MKLHFFRLAFYKVDCVSSLPGVLSHPRDVAVHPTLQELPAIRADVA